MVPHAAISCPIGYIVTGVELPYYMKFLRHVNFAFLRFAYFATPNLRDFAKICILTHFILTCP